MRILLATLLAVTLAGCSSEPAEPDATSKLIAERYADCMPGLKAEDVKRISDRRYSVITDDYAVAWNVRQMADGSDLLTLPDDESMPQMERLGCL
jgi:PBP1b-binding outer membrane lipoprotein LpoB